MLHAEQYKHTEVVTSDRTRLVVMLYEGAINFLEIAKDKMTESDIAGKALYLDKSTAIISELSCALDMKAGGEIATNLERLYDFMVAQISEANMRNDKCPINVVIKLLKTLKEGWEGVLKQEQHRVLRSSPGHHIEASVGLR